MSLFTETSTITVTCHKRLAPFVAQEVEGLGLAVDETFITGLRLRGSIEDCMRLNLGLRCGSQVLYSLFSFAAETADDVYKAVYAHPWEDIIPATGYFSVTGNVQAESITNPLFANLRVKDAIVDRIRDKAGSRPSSGSELNGVVVHLFWREGRAEIFLDTTGESLALHNYRKIPGRAPMGEALAASVILATGWDRASSFINPMCGSGTLAIEAALMAIDKRPGLLREKFAFMHLKGYDGRAFTRERTAMKARIKEPATGLRIIATDILPVAVDQARKNAGFAGVQHLIEFGVCDFAETPVPEDGGGVVVMNPEYGARLGEESALAESYRRIGDFFKQKCGGYRGFVFTGAAELAKKIGLKPKRRIEFYNATIDCRLLEYELWRGKKEMP